jgi:hypothetical protein
MKVFHASKNKAKRCYYCTQCGGSQPYKKLVKKCYWCCYRAVVCFSSLGEGRRFVKLFEKQKIGLINDLVCHPRFELKVNNKKIGNFIADFSYYKNDKFIVEDFKGRALKPDAMSSWKIKHFEAQYNIKVRLVSE